MSTTLSLPRQLERISFAKGETIFRAGDPGSNAYLIEAGRVEISAPQGGGTVTINTLGPGEIFGEVALIDNRRRTATATALEDTHAIAIDRTQLESKIAAADPLLHMLLRVVLKRFRWALNKALSNERVP
ncbi:MAG: cyclic nucleotide-binding domain-containing protein, partial [Pseudomonadota bacterium]